MKYIYTAIFEPQNNGGFSVTVPDVPGCVTSGKDMQDAIEMIKDALAGCLCSSEDHNYPIASPQLPMAFHLKKGAFAALIDVDTTLYRAQTDNRSVRKNVSIPAWMETKAERAGISLSQTLQDALRQRLG